MDETPAYVHDLLDAYLSGEPLDFRTHPVPPDVQARLTAALDAGTLTPVSYPRPVVKVAGSGGHYVWNEDHTGLIAKDGPIDGTQAFFVAPEPCTTPASELTAWPDGWVEIGATTDGGTVHINRGDHQP